jgi:hypothetical protein
VKSSANSDVAGSSTKQIDSSTSSSAEKQFIITTPAPVKP